MPELINHAWHLDEPELVTLLEDANRILGELNAFSQLVPDVDFFIKMHITKEATTSSRIEGTLTNMEEALIDVQGVGSERRDDWEEVQNYIKAVDYSIERLQTLPLSTRLLRETHKVLMQGVRGEQKLPGEFRKSQNRLGSILKNAVFVPLHHEHLVDLMGDLDNFIHNNEIHVPHLIRVGIGVFKEILELKERIERRVMPKFHVRKQLNAQALMKLLYQRPVINVRVAKELLNVQTNTASSLIQNFVKEGLLQEVTGYKRNRMFVFVEYIKLFNYAFYI